MDDMNNMAKNHLQVFLGSRGEIHAQRFAEDEQFARQLMAHSQMAVNILAASMLECQGEPNARPFLDDVLKHAHHVDGLLAELIVSVFELSVPTAKEASPRAGADAARFYADFLARRADVGLLTASRGH